MKISIIIPYYNADKWIGRCLDSLLFQGFDYHEYEIIVVDDGSNENPVLLKEYANSYPNIIYLKQDNAGPGSARNTGLNRACGEYIFFCDSDDFVAKDVLGELYSIAHKHNLDMLFHNVVRINDGDPVVSSGKQSELLYKEYTSGKEYFAQPVEIVHTGVWQFIVRRDFLIMNNIAFPSNWIMNEDSLFYIMTILKAEKVAKIEMDVYYYVQVPSSLLHLSGKKLQTEKYAENMYKFIVKLSEIINDNASKMNMPHGCLTNLLSLRGWRTYVMLHTIFRYCPAKTTVDYIVKLKRIHAYPFNPPFKNKKRLLKVMMNKQYLWCVLSFLYSLLPRSFRLKF